MLDSLKLKAATDIKSYVAEILEFVHKMDAIIACKEENTGNQHFPFATMHIYLV